jgi:hypothetical protein
VASEADIAWAAGFYEGEGHFGVKRNPYHYPTSLRLTIGQRTEEPILKFLSIAEVGKIRHRHLGEGHGGEIWYYDAGKTVQALQVLALLWPWLSERRQLQATMAIDEFLSIPHRIDYTDVVAFI